MSEHRPKFLKQFAQLGQGAIDAFATYAEEVRTKRFPSPAECYGGDGSNPALDAIPKKSAGTC
jgi:3-methyl-2-oxobutanoate hydroxymethyltransferase